MYSKRLMTAMTVVVIFYLLAPDQSLAGSRWGHETPNYSAGKSRRLKSPSRHAASTLNVPVPPAQQPAAELSPPEISNPTNNASEAVTTTTATAMQETLAASTTTTQQTPTTEEEDPDKRVLDIGKGKIRGQFIDVVVNESTTKQISRFLGVKFAEAPLGEKRYKQPEAVRPWNDVQDALEYKPNCYQWRDNTFQSYFADGKIFRGTEMWNSNTEVSEDCLYVNVWTPVTDFTRPNRDLAVMVWIYGGGFYSGSSSLDVYNGQWLAATQDVVVVSINYRVAALGFLVFDDEVIKGNAGLYDQRMGLQWVQDNIEHFGGDPSRVTIFGESAGAASVSMHLVSPKSRPLFKNAIIQSGSLLSPWSLMPVTEAKRRSTLLAEQLNCSARYPESNETGSDANERKKLATIKCFQNVHPKELVDTEISYLSVGTFRFPNAAVLSDDFVAKDPKEGLEIPDDVDVMMGYNSNEGSYFLIYGSPGWSYDTNSTINEKEFTEGLKLAIKNPIGDNAPDHVRDQMVTYSDFVYTQGKKPATMDHKSKCGSESDQQCTEQLSHMSGKPTNVTFYRDRLDDMVGDVAVVCPLFKLAEHATGPGSNSGKFFFYHFDQRSSQNPWPEWMGVMHGYEIEFVFGLPLDQKRNYTADEVALSHSMMKMWGDFAKHGNPNDPAKVSSKWKEYDVKDRCINVIGHQDDGQLTSKSSFLSPQYSTLLRHCSFWNEYFPQLFRIAKDAEPTTTPPTTMESTSTGAKVSPLHGGAGRSYPMTLLILLAYHLCAMLMMCL